MTTTEIYKIQLKDSLVSVWDVSQQLKAGPRVSQSDRTPWLEVDFLQNRWSEILDQLGSLIMDSIIGLDLGC